MILTFKVQQVAYSLQLVKPVLDGLVSAFTVKADATDAYNTKLQARLAHSIHTQCYSWQRTGGTGKVFNPFPWAVTLLWWQLRRPNWAHYTVIDGQEWVRKRTMKKMLGVLKVSALVLLSLAYARRSALLSLYEKVGFLWSRRPSLTLWEASIRKSDCLSPGTYADIC